MSFQLSFSEGQAKNPDRKRKQCIDARACFPVWKGMILHPLLVWPLPTYLAHVCVPIPSDLRGNSPLQIFWPAQCLDSLTVHKVDRQCIFGLDKRPTKVWCKEARHVGCWDDVSQQLSNFHRTAYLDFCRCHGCIFSRGEYMSKKNLKLSTPKSGYSETVCLINQKIFKTVYRNFLKTVLSKFLET